MLLSSEWQGEYERRIIELRRAFDEQMLKMMDITEPQLSGFQIRQYIRKTPIPQPFLDAFKEEK